MTEEAGTLNDSKAGDSSQSANDQQLSFLKVGDLVSTVDRETPSLPAKSTDTGPEGANKTGDMPSDAKGKEGDIKTTGTVEDDKDKKGFGDDDQSRFDQHPRFQELLQGRKDAEARAATADKRLADAVRRIEDLEENIAVRSGPADDGEPEFKDLTKMKKEELLDWQAEDPVGYARNLALQIQSEMTEDQSAFEAERQEDAVIEGTYNAYAAQHSNFDELWEQGVLEAIMSKHPGWNAINAHQALVMLEMAKTHVAELEKVRTETAAKVERETFDKIKAKGGIRATLDAAGGPPAAASGQISPELLDSKKFGGDMDVLVARSLQRTDVGI